MNAHQLIGRSRYSHCFAFYGRVSTEDNQDPESSYNWQFLLAENLVKPVGGEVVTSFFDVGDSRSIPWPRRPEASRLLAALRDPNRGFDNVVIGEPHRAFYGNQYSLTVPVFAHFGVRLWVPEVGGPIDPDNEAHDLVMSVFGGMSKGERTRVKVRVRSAMATQALMQGRYLGGRPPYGYTLKDLGPHPNPQKAADGKRLHGLTPDLQTAPVVQRIFRDFLNGNGIFAIAEALTSEGILSPSAYDQERNPHRDGRAWAKSAVRVILTNPRYTGRQVWNKQRTDEVLVDVDDVALGHMPVMRWNPRDKWITSQEVVHEPLVSDEVFNAARELLGSRAHKPATHKPHRTRHPYVLKSLIYCSVCQRRMQGQHSHGVAYYRCRYPSDYALANRVDHPKNVIMREDRVIGPIDHWIASAFDPSQRDQTIELLARQLGAEVRPAIPRQPAAGDITAEFDKKIARYRQALDEGASPAVVAGWIAEAEQQRDKALASRPAARESDAIDSMTAEDIASLIANLGNIAATLKEADPEDKLDLYRSLRLRLTYSAETQTVHTEIDLGEHRWDLDRVRGGT
ncbi:recombinase family protein [Verrucosispora sp. WMMA2121]|uniref:recombinase family protein n=1 Tax=Verrucosispora sp. WMMA2121 TaxID=3015164 RepID=UPI0022B654E5|nr:recombinase family protein [Verrucosispora sp. WMMA2121]MCZ7423790.1 recombinase family protein [Verrucosispora sp. WMMA2121]MCZ7424068.1 recombinase family protein [Verrucosispora sp. WMMA2121]